MQMNLLGKISLIVGLLGGCLGLAIGIYSAPIIGIPMAIIFVLVFGGMFLTIFKPMMDSSKLLKTGVPASATILQLWDTGVTLNENPQIGLLLEVKPSDGTPSFQVKTKLIVSRLQTSMYQPGMTLSVMYDPNNQTKVAIAGIGAASKIDPSQAESMLRKVDEENQEILRIGNPAKAIVLKYSELGINVNGNNPAVELELQVLPEDKDVEPFKATTKVIIKDTSVVKFQPGCEIFVKYDPSDTKRVSVEHS